MLLDVSKPSTRRDLQNSLISLSPTTIVNLSIDEIKAMVQRANRAYQAVRTILISH
jgi:hypothetical protein